MAAGFLLAVCFEARLQSKLEQVLAKVFEPVGWRLVLVLPKLAPAPAPVTVFAPLTSWGDGISQPAMSQTPAIVLALGLALGSGFDRRKVSFASYRASSQSR